MKIITLLALWVVCGFAGAETLRGRIVGVSDGDTATLLDASNTQYKIRLVGIDAPEKTQAFGQRSKENLSRLIFGKDVEVETTKRDRYKRVLGKILVGGVDANLMQIKDGFAWHYKAYQKEQSAIDRETYSKAEEQAGAMKKGLWLDKEPLAPWEFRRQKF